MGSELDPNLVPELGEENTYFEITSNDGAYTDPFNSEEREELSLIEQALAIEQQKQEFYGNYSESNEDFNEEQSYPLSAPQTEENYFTIVAEGTVKVNGSSDFDGEPTNLTDDALIYAGKGFRFKGNPILPVQRDSQNNPIIDGNNKQVLVENALAVSQGYLVAKANASKHIYSGLIPPTIVETKTIEVPNYEELLIEQLKNSIENEVEIIYWNSRKNRIKNANQWKQKFPAPGEEYNR